MGFEVMWARDGQQAWDLMQDKAGDFDLVITDYNMPKMSGFDLIKRVHMDQPEQRFIMVSGYKDEDLNPLIFEHEAVFDVLRKPVDHQALQRSIANALHAKTETES